MGQQKVAELQLQLLSGATASQHLVCVDVHHAQIKSDSKTEMCCKKLDGICEGYSLYGAFFVVVIFVFVLFCFSAISVVTSINAFHSERTPSLHVSPWQPIYNNYRKQKSCGNVSQSAGCEKVARQKD